jgi:effector-binding domain-containing protein
MEEQHVIIPEDIMKIGASGDVATKTTSPQQVIYAVHKGSYQTISETIQKIIGWMMANGYTPVGFPMSIYYNDPTNTPEDELLTEIQFPVEKLAD